MEEARHEDGVPSTEGWFIVNVAEARWIDRPPFGKFCSFEGSDRFPHFGVNVHVLEPGRAACHYHRENQQESFLVLQGEARVIIEDQERPLRQWDFVHCPPGADHVFVGAGDGPCAILMIGSRAAPTELFYPRNERAARYGGSSKEDTPDPRVSYAGLSRGTPCPSPWPLD